MMLLVWNLPYDTGRIELQQLLSDSLREHWLTHLLLHPRVDKVELLRIQDRLQDTTELQALIRITPNHHLDTIVKQLQGISLRGNRLHVRRYVRRNRHDRRIAFTDSRLLEFRERRQNDRRRGSLQVERAEAEPDTRPDDRSVAGYNVRIVKRGRNRQPG